MRPRIFTKLVQTTILIEADQLAQLKKLMGEWNVTLSALFRSAIAEYLRNYAKEENNASN